MSQFVCIFYNDTSEYNIDAHDIISAKISHSTQAEAQAVIVIVMSTGNYSYTNCRILINDAIVIDGYVKEVKYDGDTCRYIIEASTHSEQRSNDTDDIITKFRIENPNIFCDRVVKSKKTPLRNIDDWIIKDTITTKINQDLPIGEIDLNMKASWLRCVYGTIDLTNKIKHILTGNPLSTITPNKLKHSWFKVFAPFYTSKTSRQTKYFVAHSKLIEETSTPITFSDKFTLRKTNFQCELAIGWEYEQLEYEEIRCKIVNKLMPKTSTKVLNIDLHNVQEYMPDIYQQSFFKTNNGEKIGNTILHEVIKYMKNSLYNIYVQFKVSINCNILSLHQPIELNKNMLYIQEIEYVYEAGKSHINVGCIGSKYKDIDNNNIDLNLSNSNKNDTGMGDIIDRIIVQNDADVQIAKVRKFVLEGYSGNKSILQEFLHKNQTRVIIKTKPLKTSHINKTIYEVAPINLA